MQRWAENRGVNPPSLGSRTIHPTLRDAKTCRIGFSFRTHTLVDSGRHSRASHFLEASAGESKRIADKAQSKLPVRVLRACSCALTLRYGAFGQESGSPCMIGTSLRESMIGGASQLSIQLLQLLWVALHSSATRPMLLFMRLFVRLLRMILHDTGTVCRGRTIEDKRNR